MYNKDKQREANYKWKEKNPEKSKEIQRKATKKYRENNREKMNNIQKAYYYRHREEILQRIKERKNKEKLNKEGQIK